MTPSGAQPIRPRGTVPPTRDRKGPRHIRGRQLPKRPFDWEPYYRFAQFVFWCGVVLALAFSPGMVIKRVQVVGNTLLPASAIERSVQFHTGQNWLFWRPTLRQERLRCFAQVFDATVRWGAVGTVVVRIAERQPIGALVAPVETPQGKIYQMYMLAPDGVLFAKLLKSGSLPRVELQQPMELYLGMNVYDGISLKRTDILNPSAVYDILADKELKKNDMKYRISKLLSKKTRKLFDPVKGDPSGRDARISLTDDFNNMIHKGSLTAGGMARFTEIPQNLRDDALLMLEGDELADLNRLVLEAALPAQLVSARIPGNSLRAAIHTLNDVLPKYHFKVKSVLVDRSGYLCFNMESGVVVNLGDGNELSAKLAVLDKALQSRVVSTTAQSITVSHVTAEALKKRSAGYFWVPKKTTNAPN